MGNKCERYEELSDLLKIMPELVAYNVSVSFKPRTANYRYCRECRVFFNIFNTSEGLERCPLCGGRLRSGPKVKRRFAKYVDPTKYLSEHLWPQPRRQTTLGDFLPNLPRQAILDELI
jgi:PHP family Zn ribbon phosphoesterase